MKRHNFIRRGLLLVLMIAMLSLPAYAAGTSLKIDAPASLPAVGETFTVKVDISGNPGLCAAQYTLAFDKTVVTCVSASVGDVLKGTLSAAHPDAADGAIIAAYSVVAKDVPAYTVYGENPARFIKERFGAELKDLLLRYQWWDLEPEKLVEILPLLCEPDLEKLRRFLRDRLTD